MSESLWKYYAALRCGMAAKTSRGLAYISIALLFEIQQRVNTRATLRRSCQHFLLDEKLRKEAMLLSAEVKVLCKTVVCLNFKSIWLSWCQRTYSLIQNLKFVMACFPPWYACYFFLLQAELSGLQHHYTFFLQWLAFYSPFLKQTPNPMLLNRVRRGQRWAEEKWMN